MKKIFWIQTIVLVSAIALLPRLSLLAPADTGATAMPDHVALTWTGDAARTITITWRTDPSVTSGMVQYQKGGKLSKGAKRTKATGREIITDLGATRQFVCTLSNLSPNSEYSYRVGDGERWSDQAFFSTAGRKTRAFKFLVFGDSQSPVGGENPYGVWRKTVHNAYQANPDARFMVNVGDLVDYGNMAAHWNAWFAAAKGVIDRVPEMPVSGNHEYYGSRDAARLRSWKEQWNLPQNGPEGLKGQAYSYDYGPAHFVVLDSQAEEQKSRGDILEAQKAWLEADLATSRAKWKIVFFHKPPYSIYPGRNNDKIKAAFCPILEKHRVDIVFNAHDHGIARTYPIRADVLMKRPSEGVIYYGTGQSGGKTYRALRKMDYHTMFYNPLEQPNYFVIDVTAGKITIRAMLQDGTLIDEFFVDKDKDVSSDMLKKSEPSVPKELKPAA